MNLLVRVHGHNNESTIIHNAQQLKDIAQKPSRAGEGEKLLLGVVKSGDMSGANEDEPVTVPDRQLNRQKEWRDRMGGREGGEDWGECYCEHLQVMAESGCWVSLWNNQN